MYRNQTMNQQTTSKLPFFGLSMQSANDNYIGLFIFRLSLWLHVKGLEF